MPKIEAWIGGGFPAHSTSLVSGGGCDPRFGVGTQAACRNGPQISLACCAAVKVHPVCMSQFVKPETLHYRLAVISMVMLNTPTRCDDREEELQASLFSTLLPNSAITGYAPEEAHCFHNLVCTKKYKYIYL